MSSTNRRKEDRDPLDRYPTPRWCVHRLLEACPLPSGLWVEPCAGAGAIIRAVNEVRSGIQWVANEISPEYATALRALPIDLVTCEDARQLAVGPGASVVITNPPFAIAEDILIRMLTGAPGAIVVFLQRIGWGGATRAELFQTHKPSLYQLPQRPSFKDVISIDPETGKQRKSSQDSTEYAWFVFDGKGRYEMLGDTPDEVRKAEKAERRSTEAAERQAVAEWKMSGCGP